MITPLKRSILGLVLCAGTVGAMASEAAPPVAAAPAPVRVNATLQSYTLQVTGSNFKPGSWLTIGLVNARSMKLVARVSTYAQFAIRQCSWTIRDCSEPNPAAGTISYTIHLRHLVKASNLVVLYRYAGRLAMLAVKTQ